MPDRAWEQAKQPVRTCGLGLQDNTLTAPANYAAAMGDVARMNERLIKDFTQEDHMGPVMKVSAQIRKDQELAQIVEELRERTEDATTENICPQVDQIEHFPTQKQISRVLYDIKNKQLIQQAGADFQDAQMKLRHKNWLISQSLLSFGIKEFRNVMLWHSYVVPNPVTTHFYPLLVLPDVSPVSMLEPVDPGLH